MPRSPSIFGLLLRTLLADIRRIAAWFHPGPALNTRIEHTEPNPGWDELVLGIIDDPELSMRLLSLRGQVTMGTIGAIATAFGEIAPGAILHVDLTDAEFPDPIAFIHLERLVDQLEDRRVNIRMVGLRPTLLGPVD
jgi:hypothetical protein